MEKTHWFSVVFIIHLKENKKTIENELIKLFFKKLSSLSEQFIFPTLEFEYFKESLENRRNFNEKEEYLIHKARCRHNSALIKVSNSLGLKHIITGHSPDIPYLTIFHKVILRMMKSDKYWVILILKQPRFISERESGPPP